MLFASGLDPKIHAALGVIERELHPAFDRERWLKQGASKYSCILSSLAVYEFLRTVGFKVSVMPVYVMVRAYDHKGRELHSLGVGDHERIGQHGFRTRPPGWSGHLVVLETDLRCFIDTTLYQCRREKFWPELPGMLGAPVKPEWQDGDNELMSGTQAKFGRRTIDVAWFSQRGNDGWLGAPDSLRERRANVVAHLVRAYEKEIADEPVQR